MKDTRNRLHFGTNRVPGGCLVLSDTRWAWTAETWETWDQPACFRTNPAPGWDHDFALADRRVRHSLKLRILAAAAGTTPHWRAAPNYDDKMRRARQFAAWLGCYVRTQDFVWLLFFSALAFVSPTLNDAEVQLLFALALLQVLEPRVDLFNTPKGRCAAIGLKLLPELPADRGFRWAE